AGARAGRPLTDRAHAPGAVAAAERRPRRELDPLAGDLERALPGAELGEAGVVEDEPALLAAHEARLLDRGRARREAQIGGEAPVVARHLQAQGPHRLLDLDRDRADRERRAGPRLARGVQRVLP